MKKVVVTGANGFIGRNFIKYLRERNVEVFAIDISHEGSMFKDCEDVHLICNSLENIKDLKEILSRENIDTFYHFAWAGTTGKARADYALQSDNAKYTCDAAVLSKEIGTKKFVTTGTITENVAQKTVSNNYCSENILYGLAKLYAHEMLHVISAKHDINYVWAKLSNIYGGDNTNGNLISYTMGEFKNNKVPEYGPCEQPYNFTYIEDVLSALFLLGENKESVGEYFVSNGECRKLKEYLREVAEHFQKEVAIGKREDDGVRYEEMWFNSSRLAEVGFQPQYTFSKGISMLK